MIDAGLELPVSDQCRLLSLARSTYYYEGASETPENLALMQIIDRLYLDPPENGSRMMVNESAWVSWRRSSLVLSGRLGLI